MGGVVGQVAVTDNHVRVVHCERDAVAAAANHSQIPNLVRGVPQDGMPGAGRTGAVEVPDDHPRGVDRIGNTGHAARKRTEIFHARSGPEESMRLERWPIAEYRLADDVASVVDIE